MKFRMKTLNQRASQRVTKKQNMYTFFQGQWTDVQDADDIAEFKANPRFESDGDNTKSVSKPSLEQTLENQITEAEVIIPEMQPELVPENNKAHYTHDQLKALNKDEQAQMIHKFDASLKVPKTEEERIKLILKLQSQEE